MLLEEKRQLSDIINAFIYESDLNSSNSYDEMLLEVKIKALGRCLLFEKQGINIEKYMASIKNEVRSKFLSNELDIKFLFNTGEVIHCINKQIINVKDFQNNYNEIVEWWIEKYIKRLRNIGDKRINLSYEDGLCCLIRYCLLNEEFFCEQLKELSSILIRNVEIYSKNDVIDFGMRRGIGGWLNVLNQIEGKAYQGLEDSIVLLLDLYDREKYMTEYLFKWPAIKRSTQRLYTDSDNWSYGSSMILYNLLNSKHLSESLRNIFYKNMIYHSYQPLGDLGLINFDFYTGYTGSLSIYAACYEKYKEPCFEVMTKQILKKILEKNKNNVFPFYKYEIKNNHMIKSEKYDSCMIENFQIYCVLCEILARADC